MLDKRVVDAFGVSVPGLCRLARERQELGFPVVNIYVFLALFYMVSRGTGEQLCLVEVDHDLGQNGLKRHVIELVDPEHEEKLRFHITTYESLAEDLERCGLSFSMKEDGLPGEVEVRVLSEEEASSPAGAPA